MYKAEEIAAMSGSEFADLLRPMSWAELKNLLVYVAGWSPEGTAAALNHHERTETALMAEGTREAAGQEPAPELCHYCDVEPANVSMPSGRYCEACAPGVQLATGEPVLELKAAS